MISKKLFLFIPFLLFACSGSKQQVEEQTPAPAKEEAVQPSATKSTLPANEKADSTVSGIPAATLKAGKVVYDTYCMVCHQNDGNGVPGMNPPLTQTDWVLGDKTRLINVVLNGLAEEIEIKGEIYNNVMAPHNFLTDQQIADVLTYIRNSFGNEASTISAEEVAAVRAAN